MLLTVQNQEPGTREVRERAREGVWWVRLVFKMLCLEYGRG